MFGKKLGLGGIAVAAALCAVVLSGVFAGVASATDPCTIYWTGASSSDWATAGNWSTDAAGTHAASNAPASSDFVCMSNTITTSSIVIGSATVASVGGLDVPDTVPFDLQGSLTVGTTGSSQIGTLTMEGTLIGATSGVSVAVPNIMSITGNAPTLSNITVVNQGSASESTNVTLYLDSGSTFQNSASLVLGDGGHITQETNNSQVTNESGGSISYSGTSSSSSSTIGLPLTNNGFINVDQGTLTLSNLTNNGTVSTYGAVAQISALTNLSGGTLTGGTYDAENGGTVQLPGDVSSIASSTDVYIGSSSSGAQPSKIIDASGGDALASSLTSNAGSIELQQPLTLSNSLTNTGFFYVYGSGSLTVNSPNTVTNSGTLEDDAGGSFQIATLNNQSNGYVYTFQAASWTITTLTNTGYFYVDHTTVTLTNLTNLQSGALTGGGAYQAYDGGTIVLPGDVTHVGSPTDSATSVYVGTSYVPASGPAVPSEFQDPSHNDALATLAVNYGTLYSQQPLALTSGSFTNAGYFELYATSASSTLSGPITNTGFFEVYQGTFDDSSGSFSNSGSGAVDVWGGGTLSVSSFSQSGSSSLDVFDTGTLSSGGGTGPITIPSGTYFYGDGQLSGRVSGGGFVYVGYYGTSQILTVNGNYDNGGGTLDILTNGETGGASASDYGKLSVSGTATLSGTLQIDYISTCPPAGTQITVLQAASISGTFSAFTPNSATDCQFGVSYTSTSVILTSGAGSAPANTSLPTISGSGGVGNQLTCNNGSWSPTPTSYTYQWNRDGSAISGATGQTYTVQSADQGHTLTCAVTASNDTGPGSPATSSNSVAVPAPPAPAPTTTTTTTTTPTSSVSGTTTTATRPPAVTGVSPSSGSPSGGDTVTITGSHLTGATVVDFGSTAATGVTVVSDGQIRATSPAGTGTVDVTVQTPGGTSTTSSADRFTYVPQVVVTTVNTVINTVANTISQINTSAAATAGGFGIQVNVSTPGTLTMNMVAGQSTNTALDAQIARLVKKGTVLAKGKVVATHAGKVKIRMKLTATGKKLLKSLKKALPVQLTANFLTPQGVSYSSTRGAHCRPRHHAGNVR